MRVSAIQRLLLVGELLVLFTSTVFALRLQDPGRLAPALLLASALALLTLKGLEAWPRPRLPEFADVPLQALCAVLVGLVAFRWLAQLPALNDGSPARLWAGLAFAGLVSLHAARAALLRRWRLDGRSVPNLVIVGATPMAQELVRRLLHSREAHVLGIFDDRVGRSPGELLGVPVLGVVDDLIAHRVMPYVDRIVIAVPSNAKGRIAQLLAKLRRLPNEVVLLLEPGGADVAEAARDRLANLAMARVTRPALGPWSSLFKRTQDLIISAAALAVAGPLMVLIAVAVKLDSPGPVFFRQRRHGFNNEAIVVWKFRTMRHGCADPHAHRQTTADDDRVTRVGRILRKTSLDELPQLLNVLQGEMSLVGPRPHAIGMRTDGAEAEQLVEEYAQRHRLKPGLTGWAAVQGSRGPLATAEAVAERVRLDLEYIERQGFWMDLHILFKTIPCVVLERGQR